MLIDLQIYDRSPNLYEQTNRKIMMKTAFSDKIVSASVLLFDERVRDKFIEWGIGVELSAFSMPQFLDERALPQAIRHAEHLLKDFNLPVSMHGAFYNLQVMARDPWLVDVVFKRLLQSMEIANRLGVEYVVVHSNYVPYRIPNYKQKWLEKHIDFWSKLVPYAEQYGVKLMIENTQEPDASYIGGIVKALNHPNFKVCLDTGHTHCFTKSGIPVRDWVRDYGEHLGYIHLHSNHGDKDAHIAYTDGNMDFGGFFEALDTLPEYPQMIIEVKSKEALERSYEALKLQYAS